MNKKTKIFSKFAEEQDLNDFLVDKLNVEVYSLGEKLIINYHIDPDYQPQGDANEQQETENN